MTHSSTIFVDKILEFSLWPVMIHILPTCKIKSPEDGHISISHPIWSSAVWSWHFPIKRESVFLYPFGSDRTCDSFGQQVMVEMMSSVALTGWELLLLAILEASPHTRSVMTLNPLCCAKYKPRPWRMRRDVGRKKWPKNTKAPGLWEKSHLRHWAQLILQMAPNPVAIWLQPFGDPK